MNSTVFVPCAVIVKENKILLGKKLKSSGIHCLGKWEILGGRTNFGENYENAIVRKMKEYLGVNIKVVSIVPKIYSFIGQGPLEEKIHVWIVAAICSLEEEKFILQEGKIDSIGRFSLEEVINLHDEGKLVAESDLEISKYCLT